MGLLYTAKVKNATGILSHTAIIQSTASAHSNYLVATLIVYQSVVFRLSEIFVTWRIVWLVTTVTINISTGTMIFALIDSLDARFFGTTSLIQTHFDSEKL